MVALSWHSRAVRSSVTRRSLTRRRDLTTSRSVTIPERRSWAAVNLRGLAFWLEPLCSGSSSRRSFVASTQAPGKSAAQQAKRHRARRGRRSRRATARGSSERSGAGSTGVPVIAKDQQHTVRSAGRSHSASSAPVVATTSAPCRRSLVCSARHLSHSLVRCSCLSPGVMSRFVRPSSFRHTFGYAFLPSPSPSSADPPPPLPRHLARSHAQANHSTPAKPENRYDNIKISGASAKTPAPRPAPAADPLAPPMMPPAQRLRGTPTSSAPTTSTSPSTGRPREAAPSSSRPSTSRARCVGPSTRLHSSRLQRPLLRPARWPEGLSRSCSHC